MSVTQRLRGISHRRIGAALTGGLAITLAAIAGPALASGGTAPMQMTSMTTTLSTSQSHVGTTPGWYDGKTVKFTYTKNFVCVQPPASHANSKCEVGSEYDAVPAATFDPLYVIVPIGFTPAKSTLACPVAGHCIDHPSSIDLSAVFASAKYDNVKLPAHSHIITTTNSSQAEWWNVVVIGVTKQATWDKIVDAKSYGEITRLRDAGNKSVTSNLATNLFLFFRVS
jgi:hypothetical protein